MIFFRDFGLDQEMRYNDPMDLAHVITFVRQYNTPLLTNLGDQEEFRVRDYLQHPTPYRLLVFFKTPEVFETLRPALEAFAADLRTRALVAYTIEDAQDESNFDYTFWQVSGKDPTFLYLHLAKDRKYVYAGKDALKIETMRDFIAKVEAKEVMPKLKSEIAPVQNSGPVRVVTTTSFEKEVWLAQEQDSFVLLYFSHQPASDVTLNLVTKFSKVWRRDKRLALVSIDCRQNDILEWDDILDQKTEGPIMVYVAKEDKVTRQPTVVWSNNSAYPKMHALMDFVTKHTKMENLVRDEKVWTRLVAEEEATMKTDDAARDEEQDDPDTLEVQDVPFESSFNHESDTEDENERETKDGEGDLLSPEFQAGKEKTQRASQTDQDSPTNEEPVVVMSSFPGTFNELAFGQEALEIELRNLMKSTGFELPKDSDDRLNPSVFRGTRQWLNTMYFMFNLTMVTVFGEQGQGAFVVLSILMSLFVGLPFLRRQYRRRQMKRWLVQFYNHHKPEHVVRIPAIIDMYMELDNGMKKVQEDCIRKYVIKSETKKSK